MRESLRWLYYSLLKKENKDEVLRSYIKRREEIIRSSKEEVDYDTINEREFRKYFKINGHIEEEQMKESEAEFLCKIKFYLDCEVNHYEKDR